jgi:hypothetical protein
MNNGYYNNSDNSSDSNQSKPMQTTTSLQSLAREAENFINPDILAEFSYDLCTKLVMEKTFVSAVAKYIMKIFIHCRQRHSLPDRHCNFLAFLACPIICAFPGEYKDKAKGLDTGEIFQAVVDSGRLYSAKLVRITEFFAAPAPVDFADIPPAETEGLMELVEDYNDKYAIWKNLTYPNDGGKIFDLVRRLEGTTVMHGDAHMTARAYRAVDKLRTRALVMLGSDELAVLDAKVVSDLRKIAADQRNAELATKDPDMRRNCALIVGRTQERILHYDDAAVPGTFFDLYLDE